jgi:asparagine synthase (glutamine-hydrolysing)
MATLTGGPVETFTVGFDGHADERALAAAVARKFSTVHHEVVLTPGTVRELPFLLEQMGEPLGDPSILPTFAVARLARSRVTVVLNGDGGDELFAGYARPMLAQAADRIRRLPRPLVRAGLDLTEAGLSLLRRSRRSRQARSLRQAATGDELEVYRYRRGFWGREDLIDPTFAREGLKLVHHDPLDAVVERWGEWDAVHRALAVDVETYLSPQLLPKMDRMTMATSLEARSPFLDKELGRLARSLPSRYLVHGLRTKPMLRALVAQHVGKGLASLPKTGFAPPTATWLAGRTGAEIAERWRDPRLPIWRILQPNTMLRLLKGVRQGDITDADCVWTTYVLDVWLTQSGADVDAWVSRIDPSLEATD